MALLELAGCGALLLAAPPVAILVAECALACFPRPRARWRSARRPRLAVLVPAHDEEALLPRALRSLRDQLGPGDRVLVVAHDCRDATAAVARTLGAEVIEARTAAACVSRGKSDALLAGLAHLAASAPPEVVVILDADGVLGRGSLDALARAARFHGGPVQAEYLFRAPRGNGARGAVARSSILLKNSVRPRGLERAGLGCLVTGSGLAFPLESLLGVPQGDGAIAEDTQLALDLARRGTCVRFVPEARVTSELPLAADPARRQQRRWEHGHLELCLRSPALLLEALAHRNAALATLALEVAVPPLSGLCALLLLASACLAAAPDDPRTSLALALAVGSLAALVLALAATVYRALGLRTALQTARALPAYLAWKLPVIAAFVVDRERSWTKTPRDPKRRRWSASTSAAPSTGGSQRT